MASKINLVSASEKMRVIVSIDTTSLDDPATWNQVVARLKNHGLEISKEMGVVGTLAGTIRPEKVAALEKEKHVVAVSPDERRYTQN